MWLHGRRVDSDCFVIPVHLHFRELCGVWTVRKLTSTPCESGDYYAGEYRLRPSVVPNTRLSPVRGSKCVSARMNNSDRLHAIHTRSTCMIRHVPVRHFDHPLPAPTPIKGHLPRHVRLHFTMTVLFRLADRPVKVHHKLVTFPQTAGTERSSSTKLSQHVSITPTLEIALREEPESDFVECVHIDEFSPSPLELIDYETSGRPGTIPTLTQTDYGLRTPWAVNQWEQTGNNQSMTLPRCVSSDQSIQNNHSPNMMYEVPNLSLRSRSSSRSTRQSDDLASLDDRYVRSLYTRQSELNAQLTRLNSELLHLVHEEWVLTGTLPEGYDDLRTLLGQNTQPLKGTSYPLPRQLIRRASTFSRGYVNPMRERRNTSLHSSSMVTSLHTRGKVESKTRYKPKTLSLHQPSYSAGDWTQTHRRPADSVSQEDLAATPTTADHTPTHENTAASICEAGIIADSQRHSSTRLPSYPAASMSPQPNILLTETSPEKTTDSTSTGASNADPGVTRLQREESELDISRAAAELKLRKLEVDFAVISQLHTVHKQRAAETKRDAYKVAYKANYRKMSRAQWSRCLSSRCNKVGVGQLRRSTSDTSIMEQMFLDESWAQLNAGSSNRPTVLGLYLLRAHSLPVFGMPMFSPNDLLECKNASGSRRLRTKALEFPGRKSLSGSTYLTDSKCDSSIRTASSAVRLPARLSLKSAHSAGEEPISPLCISADQSAVQGDCLVTIMCTQRVQLREAHDRGRRAVCNQDDKELNCGEAHSDSTRMKCICSCLSEKDALPNLVQYHPNTVEDWPTSVTVPSKVDGRGDEDEGVLSISDNDTEDDPSFSKVHRTKLVNRCRVNSLDSCKITLTGSPLHTNSSPVGSLSSEVYTQPAGKDKCRTARVGRTLDECLPEASKKGKRSSLISFSLLRRAVSRVASSKRTSVCQFAKSSQPLSSPKVLPSLLTRKQIKLKCCADRQHPLDNIVGNDLHTSQPSSLSLQPYNNSSSDVPSPSKLSWTQKIRYSAR
ncbi:uncharacterized protein DEA37_0006333 [Paragonimus westermani]|uniref:Uncharacterized protein n=1 Tax=Paragonimus westermani TaxID=34504 RepID=A0A5J4NQS1_9TREM|nr:uncharacterized protein DEA37_0006333 [Paragonimus westermani]